MEFSFLAIVMGVLWNVGTEGGGVGGSVWKNKTIPRPRRSVVFFFDCEDIIFLDMYFGYSDDYHCTNRAKSHSPPAIRLRWRTSNFFRICLLFCF